MNLNRRSYVAVRWTTASNIVRACVQLAQIIVLTRLLTPLEYGLMAMVMLVISYVNLFSDMGLSTAFIQRQKINLEERSSLYWLNVLVGFFLMILTIVTSYFATYLFKTPEISLPIVLIATNFLVIALGQQLRVDAEKSLNFRPVAIIEITAALSSFLLALLMAWSGWGIYALVAATIFSTWITMLMSWLILAKGWRPLWRLRWDEVSWFVRFGGSMVLNNIINHINSTVDLFLGGRVLGATQLGIYSVPRNLILQIQFLVNPIFTRIGFPVFSSIQHDIVEVKKVYLKIMNFTATINAPIYVALAIFSEEFVQLFFGAEFQDAGPLMKILAMWGLLRSFANPIGSLLFGLGHIRLSTLWNLSMLLVVPTSIWFGAKYGTSGMAWSMLIVMAVLFFPGWLFLVKPVCGLNFFEYTFQVLLPSIFAFFAGSMVLVLLINVNNVWHRLFLGLPLGFFIYMALTLIFNRDMKQLAFGLLGLIKFEK